jgi:hypothetical protein
MKLIIEYFTFNSDGEQVGVEFASKEYCQSYLDDQIERATAARKIMDDIETQMETIVIRQNTLGRPHNCDEYRQLNFKHCEMITAKSDCVMVKNNPVFIAGSVNGTPKVYTVDEWWNKIATPYMEEE